eukprot:gene3655-6471_t
MEEEIEVSVGYVLCNYMDDELQNIFSYIPEEDLFQKVSFTCSSFRENVWKSVEEYNFKNQMKELHKQNIFSFISTQCPYLKRISVYSTVTDEVIDELGELDKLNDLKLIRCGEFTKSSFKKISQKFQHLNHLTINRIKTQTGLKHLSTLKGLNTLTMTFCKSKILKELSTLENLTELDLSYSDVSFIDFSSLKKLRKLKIQHSRINLKSLLHLKNLKELDLSSSMIVEDYETIVALNSIEKLNLSNCNSVSFSSIWLENILGYQFLKELNISNMKGKLSSQELFKILNLPSLQSFTGNRDMFGNSEWLDNEEIPKTVKMYIV